MKTHCALLAALLAAPAAWPAEAAPTLRRTPDLAKDAEAYPTLAGASQGVAKINRALAALNAKRRKEIRDCRHAAGRDYEWGQAVDVPLLGDHFVSFYVHGDQSCGGAHPNTIDESATFDLQSGELVNWNVLLGDNLLGREANGPDLRPSPRLRALVLAEADKNQADPDCRAAFADAKTSFDFWPDARAKGLAVHAQSLPHAIEGACGEAVIIPLAALKALDVSGPLVADIEAGLSQVHK